MPTTDAISPWSVDPVTATTEYYSGNYSEYNYNYTEEDDVTEGPGVGEGDPFSEEFKVACFILYTIIFIGGLVGNVLFCYIVISSRSMKTITYHLLVNLSVSDLLITCLCGPLHVIVTLVMGYWPFGSFVCYTYSYFQGISVFVSSFTLVVISFERYMCILHPLKSVIPQGGSAWLILGIWLVSLLASIPNPLQTKHQQIDEKNDIWVCTDTDPDLMFHISSVAFLVLQYILPVALTSYFYAMVAKTIWSRRDICELMDGNSHRATKELQMLRSKRKMIKMLIVVVVCYTVCWLPFNVYWVLGFVLPPGPYSPYVFTVVHILAVSHTCFNPVIYCWMNRRVRYGFMDIVGKLRIVRQCFPRVDWESTRLTRHARQTQFTVVRRKQHGIDASSAAAAANRDHFDDSSRRRSEEGGKFHRNGLQNRSSSSLRTAADRGSDAAAAAVELNREAMGNMSIITQVSVTSGCSDTSSSNNGAAAVAITTRNNHKFSTGSNNIEMAELYREEPLLQRVHNQRLMQQLNRRSGQKVSTTSTNVTELSDLFESAQLLLQQNNSSAFAATTVAAVQSSAVDHKSVETEEDLRTKQLCSSPALGQMSSVIDPEIEQRVTTQEEASAATTKYSRSISEEIAESCLSQAPLLANTKEDERYN